MLRRLLVVGKRPSLSSIRLKSTTAAESPRQNPQEGGGFFQSAGTYFRSGGREDLSAIGIGFGGLAVAAGALYYIVDSVQSSHEKISVLTANLEKERELRVKDAAMLTVGVEKERELRIEGIEKERELRAMDIDKERELRVKDAAMLTVGVEKERELRDKDLAVMRAERAVIESELRSVKLQLENARGK